MQFKQLNLGWKRRQHQEAECQRPEVSMRGHPTGHGCRIHHQWHPRAKAPTCFQVAYKRDRRGKRRKVPPDVCLLSQGEEVSPSS